MHPRWRCFVLDRAKLLPKLRLILRCLLHQELLYLGNFTPELNKLIFCHAVSLPKRIIELQRVVLDHNAIDFFLHLLFFLRLQLVHSLEISHRLLIPYHLYLRSPNIGCHVRSV